jgi:truncated hemoglobin YjbI
VEPRLSSPFEAIGGEPVIRAVLVDLYARLFDDPIVGFLFDGHDRAHLVEMQTAFTRRMLGDRTAVYTGKPVTEAHAALPILPGHFDRRHHLLRQVLDEHEVAPFPRDFWLKIDRGLRDAILKLGAARIEELRWRED